MTGNQIHVELHPQLSYFLQNFLHWKDLNDLQKETFPIINKGNDCLIIAPTASGKTESALIPIYNNILEEQLPRTSTLYIAPLKALINDMYLRITYWNKHFGLTATKWHGDVKPAQKRNYISKPTDFLLITPESLEVIFINKTQSEKEKIFGNVKYIIIDEIHYFAESERGVQLNSLLSRISEYTQDTIKIGLSATVGNPEDVVKWIDKDNPVNIVQFSDKRDTKFKLVRFKEYEEIPKVLSKYMDKKILIFAKSRNGVEFYYNILKNSFNEKNIFLHHASISKEIRKNNEDSFRKASSGIMISTSTLELGIDIGNIDIVAQISTTNTISSLLQRIGRGGRRTNIQRVLLFINSESEAILTLAQISLINQGIIEKINIRQRAKDIYLHQILSIIFEKKEISFKDIYYQLNNAYSFSKISKDDFRNIIQYLIDMNLIDINMGKLSLGYNFEKEFGKMNFMEFYSVFPSKNNYIIKNGKNIIGELDYLFVLGLSEEDTFILGGNSWKITNIDVDSYTIHVKNGNPTDNIAVWEGNGLMLNYLTSQEIYNILLGKFDSSLLNLLDQDYSNNIINWNNYFNKFDLGINSLPFIITESKGLNRIELCTFAGNYVNFLFVHLISKKFDIKNIIVNPLNLVFNTESDVNEVMNYIINLKYTFNDEFDSVISDFSKEKVTSKFIDYLPEEEQVDVVKEVLFNVTDFKDLIAKCEFKQVFEFNINNLNF